MNLEIIKYIKINFFSTKKENKKCKKKNNLFHSLAEEKENNCAFELSIAEECKNIKKKKF